MCTSLQGITSCTLSDYKGHIVHHTETVFKYCSRFTFWSNLNYEFLVQLLYRKPSCKSENNINTSLPQSSWVIPITYFSHMLALIKVKQINAPFLNSRLPTKVLVPLTLSFKYKSPSYFKSQYFPIISYTHRPMPHLLRYIYYKNVLHDLKIYNFKYKKYVNIKLSEHDANLLIVHVQVLHLHIIRLST